ncbi:MAG TPA: hypothetical protein ENI23_14605 [bacterium]|nr:hypothetical protein [bacterium]
MKKIKLIEAVEQVLEEDSKTRTKEYSWLFLSKVLRTLGFKIFIELDRRMPSPETIFRDRREIMNKRNKYAKEFIPEDNVTYEPGPAANAPRAQSEKKHP